MPTTTIGTFHSAATSTGNGSSLAVPSGDIVLNVSLVGSGPIGAVIQPQVSANNSTWVDLQPSTRIAGAGSVSSMVDVATTAAYIRVVLSEISGTNAAATVQLATYYPTVEATPTIDPSGNTVFPGPIILPFGVGFVPPCPAFTGPLVGMWGSSSDRRNSTTDANLLTETSSANGTAEYVDGWWRHFQSMFRTQFSLAWNGAVAGSVWAATAAKIASDLALSTIPKIQIAFVRPGANDIAAGTTVASLEASIRSTIETELLGRGIRVVLITSHVQRGINASYLPQYDAMARLLDTIAAENPGMVIHANTYAAFGVGVTTPDAYLFDDQHLNESGSDVAATAFAKVASYWGFPMTSIDPADYGEIIMEIDPANTSGLTTASASIASGTVDSQKRKRILLTNTANGGRVVQGSYVSGKSLSAGDICRLWADVTPTIGASTSPTYGAGVQLRNAAGVADSKRFGSYTSGQDIGGMVGNRILGLSRAFTIPTSLLTSPQLAATAGAGTNAALVGRCALIRVAKA